jgi:transketolase
MTASTTANTQASLMRDAFIDHIFEAARRNPDLMFLSADFGAKALDAFREQLPRQFLHTGIAEQCMVDVGAGLALGGKQVILYAMAPFLVARCYEQIKAVLSAMHLPVTLVGVGAGLGYDHATLTHFTPEDIAITRALNHLEVWSPADSPTALALARLVAERPAFRYIRLERQPMPPLYPAMDQSQLAAGFAELVPGRQVALVACGYLSHKALAARAALAAQGIEAGVFDLFRIKPLAPALIERLAAYPALVTVEEQLLEGGFGSALLEALAAAGHARPIIRLGLKDGFSVVNGDRDELHRLYRLDTPDIAAAARRLAAP